MGNAGNEGGAVSNALAELVTDIRRQVRKGTAVYTLLYSVLPWVIC